MSDQQPAIVVENLHKSFGELKVLKGVSLEANPGDVISLIGASGSGKSTFLRCLNLLETPDSGDITVQGERLHLETNKHGKLVSVNQKHIQKIRSKLAMVFQSFNLWAHMTVLENVIEGPVHVLGINKKEAIEQAEAILEKVGLSTHKSYYPAHMSGGQQQRAAIARALAMNPSVMLFDEPTSALDPELVQEVLKVIRDLAEEGRTMIVVTHEMAFARDVCNQIIFLHQGLIEEQGPPPELFNNPRSERLRQFLSRSEGR